ncbi:MAG: hypothetical protein A2831_00560 [Candidatus Yanofskybacteria bacterium RIFCSPHIGHO2_01_FULL_44_17]|uniref:NarL family transcriptional regulator n=1 Tax=Candidatus Yanofskybacteria bacterium RIFCSPHIGHO2_01_FULL_44_17 TaxID=1802668 RepID=A0A1F8EZ90_9BACT|nr:MAG: hypothetical protein A2831_00560 [Candidatus Yanofskybacteria bacterium RIFCSPHIGHO2_01_FULL_44_17]
MNSKRFKPGVDRVFYTKAIFGKQEIKAVQKALEEGWLGAGKYTQEFENKVSNLFGKKYGLFVNSGTSANVLAMELANLPPSSEVITQACTFPATLAPIVQKGLTPVFVDSNIGTYNIDIAGVQKAISKKTKAIFISHAIGNVNDMASLSRICKKNNLIFIEDACDTIGCRFKGQPTGKYSDITTTSFYAAHNITAAGGGGMVMVNDPALIEEARMLNDWGRKLPGTHDTNIEARFASQVGDVDFDGKFTYVRQTFNFKAVEIQAAFGLEQLKKLPKFNATRTHNFKRLCNFFSKYERHFFLPNVHKQAEAYFLAFPLTIKPESPIVRKELLTYLEENKIQTRTIFAGNILRHPAYMNIDCRIHAELSNADYIMKHGFLIGCHHGMTDGMINYMEKIFSEYIKNVEQPQVRSA